MLRDIELRLDITDTCNLRCIMCHQPFGKSAKRIMTLKEFHRITAGILPRVNSLFLSWTAEPMLNNQLPEILADAAEAGVPCVMMVSNLTLPLDNAAHAIVEAPLHRLNVSVDAAQPSLFAIIRQEDRLADVLANVHLLQDLKRKRGTRYPHIAFNMVLLKMNVRQILPLVDLAKEYGIDELNCSSISVPARYDRSEVRLGLKGLPPDFNLRDQLIDFNDSQVKSAVREAVRYADRKGVLMTIPGRFESAGRNAVSLRTGMLRYALRKAARFPARAMAHFIVAYCMNLLTSGRASCSYPWRQMVVGADGSVAPCCVWDDETSLGNTNEKSLTEIWRGTPIARLRAALACGSLPNACRRCTRMGSKIRHCV